MGGSYKANIIASLKIKKEMIQEAIFIRSDLGTAKCINIEKMKQKRVYLEI